jgi:hypothetical protein
MDASMPGQHTRVAEPRAQAPASFVLEQNYPNPLRTSAVHPGTTIAFQLPQAIQVSLKIYDVAGNEVARLLDHRMQAGRHEIAFDAQALASGIYFYRLQAGKFTAEKKLLVLR